MTTEEIKKNVDDERAEQLTVQLCRHWDVATQRLECLAQELTDHIDTCVEAEIYAALMRMQKTMMALIELNKIPTTFLFSEYLDRINQTVSNNSIRQSVITLIQQLLRGTSTSKQGAPFFDLVLQMIAQHVALPVEQQEIIRQMASPQYIFSVCAQHLNPEDLMMVAQVIQNVNTEGDAEDQEEITGHIQNMRQVMETLDSQMRDSLQMMLMELLILALLPAMIVRLMQQSRTNSNVMAHLFNKVLMQVRESNTWWEYWKERRETLRVVSDSSSWRDIMTAERTKERTELGQVPGGLFAKWTTDRELNPTTKFGDEQLVLDDLQRVGDAVLEAANKLSDLVAKTWQNQYDAMWQELIKDETIFAHLKVTRKSPHNNLFTARFFCHLVGEMKKSAVFGAHSDGDLAEKLTEQKYVGTFRKNIQEGMGEEKENVRKAFTAIYQIYKQLIYASR